MPNELDRYIEELSLYRQQRNKPKNPYHYLVKATEELGEVAEALLAVNGLKKKANKIRRAGDSPKERLLEETGDVLNTIMLLCNDNGISPGDVLASGRYKLLDKRVSKE